MNAGAEALPAAPSGERGSNFFAGFLFLPKAKREALSAVYAYCRLIDDIVDSGELRPEAARKSLEFWRAELERLYAGEPGHQVSRRLLPAVRAFGLRREDFLEIIRGCALDLERARYEDFKALESYMQGVACSVGRLSVAIFGYRHTAPEKMEEFAKLFGYAFQLTNIIRDVGVDLELGRVYLPESDMREAGTSRERLIAREHGPAFERLMLAQYERAKGFYRRGRALVDFRDRPALLPAEIMAHIYEGLLDDIRAGGFRVLFGKHRLSPWRKAALALKGFLYCFWCQAFRLVPPVQDSAR